MSVLVDTSVWIRFLSNRAPFASQLDTLLSRGEVSGHEGAPLDLSAFGLQRVPSPALTAQILYLSAHIE